MALIKVSGVSLGYEGKAIVTDLDFEVNKGDYLCIVGENGSGKSTLMKTLLGQKNVVSGKIEFGDGLKQNEIGYLPQQTPVQKDFPASVKEIVYSGCLNGCGLRPFYSKEQKKRANDIMDKLGISDLASDCYRELSGGQQQRVLLARALCATKKLLVLDEPVAGLDPVVTKNLYRLISDINNEGTTVIMVSHDIHAAIEFASHILHIGNKPLFFGTKEDYQKSDGCHCFICDGGHEND
ncbi:MAG: metal ABC transporter ATP-binding protein [Clostridia bacterium]|nr:metal ABC transporter ATP-binding protein [Clostridia bacterium]MBR3818353.1 metal ABC transporter ATP-binding protein [Clostridia bacterium]